MTLPKKKSRISAVVFPATRSTVRYTQQMSDVVSYTEMFHWKAATQPDDQEQYLARCLAHQDHVPVWFWTSERYPQQILLSSVNYLSLDHFLSFDMNEICCLQQMLLSQATHTMETSAYHYHREANGDVIITATPDAPELQDIDPWPVRMHIYRRYQQPLTQYMQVLRQQLMEGNQPDMEQLPSLLQLQTMTPHLFPVNIAPQPIPLHDILLQPRS